MAQRSYVLSTEDGNVFRNKRLVVKQWKNKSNQRFTYQKGSHANFKMAADQKLCIDSWRGRNVDNNKMIVWTCHKGQNQKFTPVTT